MQNSSGRPAVAYTEWAPEISHQLEDFREVDVIRLMELCLDEWLDFAEMKKQGVISLSFTGADFDEVKQLHSEWGSLTKIWMLPSSSCDDQVRDYFGEEVALFFRWFAFYTQMLVPLAIAGVACGFGGKSLFASTLEGKRQLQVVFTFFLIAWASLYNTLFKRRAARDKQRWGMKDHEESFLEHVGFDPLLEGTCKLTFYRLIARVIPILYCIFFVLVVLGNDLVRKFHRQTGMRWLHVSSYISTTVLIKVFQFLWARIAPCLANLQNHRTQGRWNDAMIHILGSVKLFVTLFPFIQQAFIKGWLVEYCAPTLAEAAGTVYGKSDSWPKGVPHPNFVDGNVEVTPDLDLSWLEGHYSTKGGQYCIGGCFPAECFPRKNGTETQFICVTNCIHGLEKSLQSVYILHIMSTVAFVLIPIALTKLAVEREILKDKAEGKVFSLLQFQAKCASYAPYEFMSWGGSQVEDFLELAIGYALLTCFGIVQPDVTPIALLSHVVEYRLLAYRMTNITCRPFPLSADGIGSWQTVFEMISMCAVVTNVGLAVTQMYPMRSWPAAQKFVAFVGMEHLLAFMYLVLTYVVPAEPGDVKNIEDFNADFKRRKAWCAPLPKVPGQPSDVGDLEISPMSRADSCPNIAMWL